MLLDVPETVFKWMILALITVDLKCEYELTQ